MELIVFLCFLLLFIFNFFLVTKKIDYRNLSFSDGFLIGLLYYISIPMVFISFFGEIDTIFNMEPYRPAEDIFVTSNILIGAFSVIFSWFVLRRKRPINNYNFYDLNIKKWSFLFISLYFVFSIISFILSGKASGGHWHETTHIALTESTFFILFLTFTNIIRTCAFGVIIFLVEKFSFSRKKAILIGLAIVVFDLLTSFNRITGVYFIVMMLIIFREYKVRITSGLLIAFPFIFIISSIWPAIRGLALSDGYSVNNFMDATSSAIDNFKDNFSNTINNFLFPIFESANIVAFKYVITNSGSVDFPYLMGETYLVRSIFFLIPTTIWEDKPAVFASILGDHMQGGGVAINSTFFGEIYANFYFLWPIVLILSVIILNEIFIRLKRWFAPASFCGAFIAFALWRFDATFMGTSIFLILIFVLFKSLVLNLTNAVKKKNHRL